MGFEQSCTLLRILVGLHRTVGRLLRRQHNRLDPRSFERGDHFQPPTRGQMAGEKSPVAHNHAHRHLFRHNAPESCPFGVLVVVSHPYRRGSAVIRPDPGETGPNRTRQTPSAINPTTTSDATPQATAAGPHWAADDAAQ